jgi:hypothetical protein
VMNKLPSKAWSQMWHQFQSDRLTTLHFPWLECACAANTRQIRRASLGIAPMDLEEDINLIGWSYFSWWWPHMVGIV